MGTKLTKLKSVFKKINVLTVFALILTCLTTYAQNFPEKPNQLVNDYTNTLTENEVSSLENKLVAFDKTTSTQIAIVLVKSLEGYDVADYAVRLAEKWGIGGDKNNNGVLLLASLGDRKVTIQTGYGVEGALPDAIARRIIENEIKPNFKSGNYFAGVDAGTNAIISYAKGEYKADPKKENGKKSGGKSTFIIIIIIILIVIISRRGGGGNQVIGRRGSSSPFWWMLLGSGLGRGSGGGFGGFSGGGGSSGGGFGGFGGGSFGGGGASGDW